MWELGVGDDGVRNDALRRTANQTLTVGTNNSAGYKLLLESSVADTTLAKGSDTIAATSGTFAAPAALGNDTWGYRLASFAPDAYAGIKTNGSPDTLKTTATPVASDATVVTWGSKVTTAKPSGTYSRIVTFTAVTN